MTNITIYYHAPSCITVVFERLFYILGVTFVLRFDKGWTRYQHTFFTVGNMSANSVKKSCCQISTLRSQAVDLGEGWLKCKLNLHTTKATDSKGRRVKILIKTPKCCVPLSLILIVCFCKSSFILFAIYRGYLIFSV